MKKTKNINQIQPTKILCRNCAVYSNCKLEKKGYATKCRNFWQHIDTSNFTKNIK